MRKIKYTSLDMTVFLGCCLLIFTSCSRDLSDDVKFATFPTTPEVFIDSFSGGLDYFPYGGSTQDAFSVDAQVFHEGTASMRFDVPVGDKDYKGKSYAGAYFPDKGGRDLTGYDALTFWGKSTKSAIIGEIGFGQDGAGDKFQVTKRDLRISTAWKKYIIPIPDPSKLTLEKGMFWYSEKEDDAYSFWIDDLKYEKLGTIAQPRPAILGGATKEEQSFIGDYFPITGTQTTFNLADGTNETVSAKPSYFTFQSSDADVARVSELGVLSIVGKGDATITAILGGVKAKGSLVIKSIDNFQSSPLPTRDSENVLSVFSDAFTNIPVKFYNGFWQPHQKTLGGSIKINDDEILRYINLNFVGIELLKPTDVSQMTHFHVDIKILESIDPNDKITIKLVDYGADNKADGGDNSTGEVIISSNQLKTNTWISLDILLKGTAGAGDDGVLSGLANQSNFAQIVFNTTSFSGLLVDNMYFYK